MGQPIDQNRNIGLDIIRATAILMVLISHGRTFLPEFTYRDYLGVFGFLGVELFFVLSGFLLGGILFKQFALKDYSVNTLKYFWIRRWFRTLPLYFIFLLLNICVLQYSFGAKEWNWAYFFFLQNFITPHPSLMPEAWSLAVEEWFYISFPLVLFLLLKFFKNKMRGFLILTIGYIVFFSIMRIYFAIIPNLDWDGDVRKIVTLRLDAIGFGVLSAYLCFYYKAVIAKYKNYILAFGIILILVIIGTFFYFKHITLNTFFTRAFLFPMVSLSFALLILRANFLSITNEFVKNQIVKISLYSYSAYLVHLSVIIPTFKSFEIVKKFEISTFCIFLIITLWVSSYL